MRPYIRGRSPVNKKTKVFLVYLCAEDSLHSIWRRERRIAARRFEVDVVGRVHDGARRAFDGESGLALCERSFFEREQAWWRLTQLLNRRGRINFRESFAATKGRLRRQAASRQRHETGDARGQPWPAATAIDVRERQPCRRAGSAGVHFLAGKIGSAAGLRFGREIEAIAKLKGPARAAVSRTGSRR